ncbi:hypothetical protein FJZ20_01655 [Candidatus Pacearchaeota archaeon]|nr:hypothetical protein [Candidatus Pacearchaeota archaeon]
MNLASLKSRRAAMEMSVGTMVTIVLLMVVLVLGIFLVQRIFRSGTNAIDSIDAEVQSQIQKLFAEEGRNVAIYPTSREVTLKKGDTPKGFAFSVKNTGVEEAEFTYVTSAMDVSKCGTSFTKEIANSYLLGGEGSFNLGGGNTLDFPRMVRFDIPETAPPCPIVYNLEIRKDGESYSSPDILITIK